MAMSGAEKTKKRAVGVGPKLLIGTRKSAVVLTGNRARRSWKVSAPMFLGNIVHHLVLDPRDRRTILAAAKTGHLGPTVFRSTNGEQCFDLSACLNPDDELHIIRALSGGL